MGDSAKPDTYNGARLVLVLGLLLGAFAALYTFLALPNRLGIDFQVYYVAAEASLAGENFYTVAPPDHPEFYYLYPPLTVVLFYPFTAFSGWVPAFVVFTALKLVAGSAVALLLIRITEASEMTLARFDRVLIGAYVLLSIHSIPSLLYGQVNLYLVLALVLGFYWLDRNRGTAAGVAFAAAAFVKMFPAAIGVWLLRRRSVRAIVAATATGIGLWLLSVATFGVDAHRVYLTEALLPRMDSDLFVGGLDSGLPYVTIRRPISVALPGLDPAWLTPIAFFLLAPVVAYLYTDVQNRTDRLVAIHGTLTAILLFFPSFFVYVVILYPTLVPLLYRLEHQPARRLFLSGAAVASFAFTLQSVENAVSLVPAPASVTGAFLAVLEPLLTFGTPPLYGSVLMLAGCVAYRRTRESIDSGGV